MLFVGMVAMYCGYASGQNISDEARRHFDRGMAAVEMAKAPGDFEVAISEFKQATTLAPDWADAYYNLGKVQERAEKFADAIASLRQYLSLKPNAQDAAEVRSLINKLQFKAESVMSTTDIVSVLSSFGKWEAEGDCFNSSLYREISKKEDASVNVLIQWLYYRKPDKTFKELKVRGPIIKYRHLNEICDPKITGFYCSRYIDNEIEVQSLDRVKVTQTIINFDEPNPEKYRPGQKLVCEFVRPRS